MKRITIEYTEGDKEYKTVVEVTCSDPTIAAYIDVFKATLYAMSFPNDLIDEYLGEYDD